MINDCFQDVTLYHYVIICDAPFHSYKTKCWELLSGEQSGGNTGPSDNFPCIESTRWFDYFIQKSKNFWNQQKD